MLYSNELDELNKATEQLKLVRFWCERMAGYGDEHLPSKLNELESELSSIRERLTDKCNNVKRKFEDEYGYWKGARITAWNPHRKRSQTEQRIYIRSPNDDCNAPHLTKFEFDKINSIIGCDEFAYSEPFDIFVIDGKKVVKVLHSSGD